MVTVEVEGRIYRLEGVKTVGEILKALKLPKAGFIAIMDGNVITGEDEVPEDARIKLIKVWSGG